VKAKGLAGYLLFATVTLAAEATDFESKTVDQLYGDTSQAAAPREDSNLLRPLGVFLALSGIAGATYVLLRKLGVRRPTGSSRNINVIEVAYLSPKHTLALVRVRNRILLLGLGQEVRTLAAFHRPEEVMSIDGSFSEELRSALSEEEHFKEELVPYRRQVSRLREALTRWRISLRGGERR